MTSPEGLRPDGRRQAEIRRLRCQLETTDFHAEGSATLAMGLTVVRASVFGPREPQRRSTHQDLVCEVTMSPAAQGEWNVRGRHDRMLAELASQVQRSLQGVVLTKLYPGSEIVVRLRVDQADGGVRCACINAATLALVDAGVCMRDYLCACAVGYVNTQLVIDPTDTEGAVAEVAVAGGGVLLVNVLATLPRGLFDETLRLAVAGCQQVREALDTTVRQHMQALADHSAPPARVGLLAET